MMSEGTVSELCRVLQKQGYRGDAVSVFADSLAYITHLEAQLAARNQAAEAMGVLERWLTDGSKEIDISRTGDVREVLLCEHHGATTAKYGKAESLIEAVLKAGGEG